MKALALVALLLPTGMLLQTTAGTKIAVIDLDRTIAEAPGGKEAIGKVTAFVNEQQAAIAQKEKEANDLESQMRSQDRVLSEAAKSQLTKDVNTARTALEQMQAEAQAKLDNLQQEVFSPIARTANTVVQDYAREQGLDIVFDLSKQPGILYYRDTVDITTEIIRRIASKQVRLFDPNRHNQSVDALLHDVLLGPHWVFRQPANTLEARDTDGATSFPGQGN